MFSEANKTSPPTVSRSAKDITARQSRKTAARTVPVRSRQESGRLAKVLRRSSLRTCFGRGPSALR